MRKLLLLWLAAWPLSPAWAQNPPLAERTTATPEWTSERLEQLVAPIALYSDGVLAQVLMASTYPLEIVQASRWVAKNPKLGGAELEKALKSQDWDPSVKSLCGLRDVLQQMNDNLDWTQDLGDAFLAEKQKLMEAVQVMRRKALEAGQLKSTDEQKVSEQDDQTIVVEQTSTEVVYVPTYYPSVVYGSWTYPYWYYPPLYVPPPPGRPWYGFAAGVVWGAAIWGGCHWNSGHCDVDIDVDHHNEWTAKVDREAAANRIEGRQGQRGEWAHSAEHRKGAAYSDARVAQRYGGSAGQARVTREQARGQAGQATQRPAGTSATRDVAPDRSAARSGSRASTGAAPAASTRTTGSRTGSFSGSGASNLDRASSTRGATSRTSSASSTGTTRSTSASRSSGAIRSSGGMRSGGGGRGGGRR
ncbi:MAG: DUF3300 domain-containing protein [Planctomycetes bacterium]|nr:DUF3300 domain-containing protein [Planctomycetota bacterium]